MADFEKYVDALHTSAGGNQAKEEEKPKNSFWWMQEMFNWQGQFWHSQRVFIIFNSIFFNLLASFGSLL